MGSFPLGKRLLMSLQRIWVKGNQKTKLNYTDTVSTSKWKVRVLKGRVHPKIFSICHVKIYILVYYNYLKHFTVDIPLQRGKKQCPTINYFILFCSAAAETDVSASSLLITLNVFFYSQPECQASRHHNTVQNTFYNWMLIRSYISIFSESLVRHHYLVRFHR